MSPLIPLFLTSRMLLVLLLGFSSGLPLALTGGTLQAWLTDAGIALPTISRFALVGIPYTLKFLWAPLLDECMPPFFGRRRGWGLLCQLCLIGSILALGMCNPTDGLPLLAIITLFVVFFSATQDVILDALRTEILPESAYGVGAGMYVMGYRIAMLVSGALALYLADATDGLGLPWGTVYWIMASFLLIGVGAIALAPEPAIPEHPSSPDTADPKRVVTPRLSLRERMVLPFVEFFSRPAAISIVGFVTVYKLSTMMATSLTVTFLMTLGYSKTEIGTVTKIYGLIATIAGTLAGGALMTKMTLKRALWVFGVVQSLAGLSFLLLTAMTPNTPMLILVVTTENFMIGLGVAAISAFMMTICSKQFTGSQFALLSSVTAVSRVVLVSPAGELVAAWGWSAFYLFSVALALPGLLLLTQFDTWIAPPHEDSAHRLNWVDYLIIGGFIGGLILIAVGPLVEATGVEVLSAANIAKVGAGVFCGAFLFGFFRGWRGQTAEKRVRLL